MKLGIGVTTYNRAASLKRTLDGISAYTSQPFVLVVADDGSTDETRTMAHKQCEFMRCPNGGIARNKNRLLWRLFAHHQCDIVILIEDDVTPVAYGWEDTWTRATSLHGHMNIYVGQDKFAGQGDHHYPYLVTELSGQIMGISRRAWLKVGFMDPRFRSYGYEHAEYSRRMIRSGFGGMVFDGIDYFKAILSSKTVIDQEIPSTGTPEMIRDSLEVLKQTIGATGFRNPWLGKTDKKLFLLEVGYAEVA